MQGFILTDGVYDRGSKMELSYWVATDSGPCLLKFNQEKALFFVQRDAKFSIDSGVVRKELPLKAFNKNDVDALYFNTYKSQLNCRDNLAQSSVRTYESDVRPTDRFLMERFINGSLEFEGEFQELKGVKVYINPKVKQSLYVPHFSIMSLDIETSMGDDLYSIAIHQRGCKNNPTKEYKKVYMIGDLSSTEGVEFFPDEKSLLQKFLIEFRSFDPDMIAGWHIIGFDFLFLEKKCQKLGIELSLGRDGSKIRIQDRQNNGFYANINGRAILDGPWLLKSAFYKFENFKLDTVARELLGVGKDISDTGEDKVAEIGRRFREDKMGLAKYNLMDCTLVLDIFEKINIVDHITKRVLYSGQLIDRIGMSSKAFDHVYLPHLHRKGYVAGNVTDIQKEVTSLGGYVMDGEKGLHDHVIVLDFKSLYPTIIQTFKIDPYSKVMGDHNHYRTINGIKFSKSEHILPGIIKNLLDKRQVAKDNGDKNLSQAIKILMNSFYGVMGSGGCRFYNADLPESITHTGQWLLKESIDFFEKGGHHVVYGDTDSLFIKLNFLEIGSREKVATNMARKVTEHLSDKIKRDFGLTSYLEMEYEKYFEKFFIPESRSGDWGAKKRYAGLLDHGNKTELHFSGMEFVRSDWTKLAKKFQYTLFEKFFSEEKIESFIKEYVESLKKGDFDDLLVYKKRLSKDVSLYTKSNPPHVRAARQLLEKQPHLRIKQIEYIWTRRGPVPIEFTTTDIDYQHYIDKQIAPLAQDVLKFLDTSFDDIVAGSQMTLF